MGMMMGNPLNKDQVKNVIEIMGKDVFDPAEVRKCLLGTEGAERFYNRFWFGAVAKLMRREF